MSGLFRILAVSTGGILLLAALGISQPVTAQELGKTATGYGTQDRSLETQLLARRAARLSKAFPMVADSLANRGFEDDAVSLDPWAVVDSGSGSWFVQSGTTSPINLFAVPPPTEGSQAAMTDQTDPGAHILFQDVALLASPASIELKYDLYADNTIGAWIVPSTGTLSPNDTVNQHIRVDIMDPGAAVDDVGAGVWMNLYRPVPGVDTTTFGYTEMTADLSAFAGQTVRLRFAEVDNQGFSLMGVDNVRLTQTPIIPATPTLLNPLNGAIDVPLTELELQWTSVPYATRYNIQVSTNMAFSSILWSANVGANQVKFTPPTASTTFFWRVQSEGVHGNSTFSAPFHFSTVPGVPTLLNPLNGAVDVPLAELELQWTSVLFATRYNIQVATDMAFSSIIWSTNVGANQVKFTPPTAGTIFYWRVQSEGQTPGVKSAFSAPFHFTTVHIPNAPTLLEPPNGAVDVPDTTRLRWSAEPFALRYNVQVATDMGFGAIVFSTNIPANSVQFIAPAAGVTYFWRVQSVGQFGNSDFSAPWHFTTVNPKPDIVILIAPMNGATDVENPVGLQWNAAAHADSYLVQVSLDSTFADSLSSTETGDLTIEFVAPFAGETYFWRVQGMGPGGSSPGFSDVWRFTVAAQGSLVPLALYPEDGATGVPVDLALKWQGPESAPAKDKAVSKTSAVAFFHVQLSTDEAFENLVVDQDSVATDSLQVTGLMHETEYYWRVAGVDDEGNFTFNEPRSFTTVVAAPGAVTLIAPANGATGVSGVPEFSWQAVAGATAYQLQVSKENAFVSPVIDDDALTTATFKPVTPLDYGTGFYWRVRAMNEGGWGEWSEVHSFTTATGTAVEEGEIPTSYALHANYPNPFNPSTKIVLDLPEAAAVKLAVYDVAGHEVMLVSSGRLPAGRHAFTIDASALSSGVYLYRVESAVFTQTKRMTLLK